MKFRSAILAALLAAAQLLLLFSGCSTATTDENVAESPTVPSAEIETEPEAVEEEGAYVYDDLPEADFDGYDFRILSCYFYNKELATYITFD